MKFVKLTLTIGAVIITLTASSCKKSGEKAAVKIDTVKATAGAPPKTWQEHWFEHNQLLTNVYYNDDLALYYDKDMDPAITWPRAAFTKMWKYVKKTYGNFGDSSRLYVIFHADKYGGGHPSDYFDASHDYRNVIDVGLGANDWYNEGGERTNLPIHEIGHIVASASHGRTHDLQHTSVWGDSKFAEIFVYDVLMNTGYENEAAAVVTEMQTTYDDFPQASTQWFKNWFYPIWGQYGHGKVLARYFELISKNVDMNRDQNLNMGEFVHFFSGAAGVNLKAQATIAFGWDDTREQQFKQAQQDYPGVKYPY